MKWVTFFWRLLISVVALFVAAAGAIFCFTLLANDYLWAAIAVGVLYLVFAYYYLRAVWSGNHRSLLLVPIPPWLYGVLIVAIFAVAGFWLFELRA